MPSCREVVPAAAPNQINTYPNPLWLCRRWRAIHPCRPCPPCRNPRALGDRRLVPRGPLKGLAWAKGTRAGCSPCSDRESRVPRLRNHWPSTLPVTEKAQQEPHMPCKTMVTVKALSSGPVQSAFLFPLPGLHLVLHFSDSPFLPPVPFGRGEIIYGLGWTHLPARLLL